MNKYIVRGIRSALVASSALVMTAMVPYQSAMAQEAVTDEGEVSSTHKKSA
jgi:hypothetical protein